jgi:hypothetical protein
MKSSLVQKAQRKLQFAASDYTYDENYLGDLYDEAVGIICDWKRLSSVDSFLDGRYDMPIVRYIVESVNMSGVEGQVSSSANGNSKTFHNTPEGNLKTSIPQSI